tara:strand:+ start:595 stop:1401 length:807 start_codon:yes stop_codon:yes gene_type:complete
LKSILAIMFCCILAVSTQAETRLDGDFTQGGLVIGATEPGSKVALEGQTIRVSPEGLFVFGFTRDAPGMVELLIESPQGRLEQQNLHIKSRQYDIQKIDGLPPKLVTPPAKILSRIRREGAAIKKARTRDTAEAMFATGFIWPARGRISGVYGSQRILNGKPRRPHFGIDIAAPINTPVMAPADGIVRLAEPDLYFSGGTIILDHGHGLSSAFLHLDTLTVTVGQRVPQGSQIGTIGATGRVTGPHLDWRINWFDRRLDPGLLVGPMN